MTHYVAFLHRAIDGYGVSFPDLPGCVSAGDTIIDAVIQAEAALADWIEVTREHGEAVPPPRAPEDIPTDPDAPEETRFLVAGPGLTARPRAV